MSDATPTMSRLIKALQGLPGIGARTAERLAFYLMNAPEAEAAELSAAITEMRSRLTECSICFNRGDADPCALCSDPARDRTVLCVVETSRDVARIEETGLFRGLYHVLKGHLAPLDGIGPEQLTLEALTRRTKEQGIKEVILATNPTLESDATALEVVERLRPLGVRLTRLARGLPMGGTLEFVNRGVLTDALQGRQELK